MSNTTSEPGCKPDVECLNSILNGLPVGVFVISKGRTLYFNTTFCSMIGFTPEGVRNATLDSLLAVTPRGKDYAAEKYRKLESGELAEHEWENPMRKPDGTNVILRGFARKITFGGQPAIVVTLRDITVQKEAENRLKETRDLFELIGANSTDFIYVHDKDSHLSYVSPAVETITGYPADEWTQSVPQYVVPGPLKDHAYKATRDALETGVKQPAYNVEIRTRDGRRRILEVNEAPIAKNGFSSVIVGVARDITERLESEEKLKEMYQAIEKRNMDLVRANQEMEAFIYTVSHDLKAPLVTLHGMTERLIKSTNENLDDKSRHYLERILVNVERLEDLVLDLLELSRIGRIEEARETIEIADCLKESIEECTAMIEQHGLSIKMPDTIGLTQYSRKRLRQVFTNLLTNAAKYGECGREPVLLISGESRGNIWELAFRDNGRGIDPKFQEKVFQAFQRPGSRKEDEGTGIGLTIVKRIIEFNGGGIRLESEPGKGSTFYITIPRVVDDGRNR
ncbi:PAS domain S-box protein [bacterium]|nr:PAS domain S-box protein [candidate division CSSED10-310 bacterium]